MTLSAYRPRANIFLMFVTAIAFTGCQSQQPASPVSVSTTENGRSTTLVRWENGPTAMFCAESKSGTSSCTDRLDGPPWKRAIVGRLPAANGQTFEWRLETSDGKSVECKIDSKPYSLENGSLFIVMATNAGCEVVQLRKDLRRIAADPESCKQFVAGDQEIASALGSPKT